MSDIMGKVDNKKYYLRFHKVTVTQCMISRQDGRDSVIEMIRHQATMIVLTFFRQVRWK